MNRLNLLLLLPVFLLLTALSSCNKKTEMPVWKITKPNVPISYLVGTINYVKKAGNEQIISPKISQLLDSTSTFITQIDIINSDFLITKNKIEIGMNKTLKDVLSEKDFNTLSELKNEWSTKNNNKFETPDSARIKLLFYLLDIIYQNNGEYLYFEQIWLQQAMASQKHITGLESYQKHYQDLSQIPLSEQIDFMHSIGNIEQFKKEFNSSVSNYYIEEEYEKIYTKYLNSFPYNKTNYATLWVEKHRNWATTLDTILNKENCFIAMDVKHLYGKENLLDNLLLKGYKINKIQ